MTDKEYLDGLYLELAAAQPHDTEFVYDCLMAVINLLRNKEKHDD